MSAKSSPEHTAKQQPFVISRLVDAPRELVWRMYTEAEHLKNWFGPKGFAMPTFSLDLRPGGIFHYCMRSADGIEMWGKWTFREIVAPERLVVIVSFSDANAGITRHPMSADWPLETLGVTTFTEQAGKTLLTVEWSPYNSTQSERDTFNNSHASMEQGWGGTFVQLTEYLARTTRANSAVGAAFRPFMP